MSTWKEIDSFLKFPRKKSKTKKCKKFYFASQITNLLKCTRVIVLTCSQCSRTLIKICITGTLDLLIVTKLCFCPRDKTKQKQIKLENETQKNEQHQRNILLQASRTTHKETLNTKLKMSPYECLSIATVGLKEELYYYFKSSPF